MVPVCGTDYTSRVSSNVLTSRFTNMALLTVGSPTWKCITQRAGVVKISNFRVTFFLRRPRFILTDDVGAPLAEVGATVAEAATHGVAVALAGEAAAAAFARVRCGALQYE